MEWFDAERPLHGTLDGEAERLVLAALRHVDKRHERVIVPTALRYPYLCSTAHVAHAHRMRGYGGLTILPRFR